MSIEKKQINPINERPFIFPVAGLMLGLFIWVADAIIDVMILGNEQNLLDNIFHPEEATELWMRFLILLVFVLMGFYSRYVLIKHIQLDKALLNYQQKLEQVVASRTRALQERTTQLEILASTDALTGLYNRRKFSQLLDQELDRFERYQHAFVILNIDIDFFKSINDSYGHQTGDKVLQQFSTVLKSNIRNTDSAGRWGGEEFIVLIIETDMNQAKTIAENIVSVLNKTNFEPVGKVTASIGLTQVLQGDTAEEVIKRSDQALYKAKENGRNRIEIKE